MPRTEVRGGQIKDATVDRDDLNVTTAGKAVVTKTLAGDGIKTTQTGVDFGTGDVTVSQNRFTSSQQTITASGSLTIAHGLGVVPYGYSAELVCVTAQRGYSVNDVVQIKDIQESIASSGGGIVVIPDATNLVCRFGSDSTTFYVLHKTTGNEEKITNANWRLVLKAWA